MHSDHESSHAFVHERNDARASDGGSHRRINTRTAREFDDRIGRSETRRAALLNRHCFKATKGNARKQSKGLVGAAKVRVEAVPGTPYRPGSVSR
jgi:hypothetical protein